MAATIRPDQFKALVEDAEWMMTDQMTAGAIGALESVAQAIINNPDKTLTNEERTEWLKIWMAITA
jgi:hypothetical protein